VSVTASKLNKTIAMTLLDENNLFFKLVKTDTENGSFYRYFKLLSVTSQDSPFNPCFWFTRIDCPFLVGKQTGSY
jgi:hypothetical protein